MPYADVNGQRLFFEDTGGDGPPIVMSHGFLMDHDMFRHQVAEFAPAYRVVTWDARSSGDTRSDGEPFSCWDVARDLFGLLDTLGIERAVLVGMSQGGYVSLRAAMLHPDRVRALILLDTQAPPEDAEQAAGYRAMLDRWIEHGYQQELADVVADLIIGDPDEEARWMRKWASWPAERLATAAGALLDRDDVTDRLHEIDAPTLVIHGAEDRAVPVARAEELRDAIRDSRGLVVIEGAAHAPNLTHPDRVNPVVREFLEGLPA